MRQLARILAWGAGAAAALALLLTAVIGFAHTRPGRPLMVVLHPLMVALAPMAGQHCPFGYDRAADPQQRAQARAKFSASHRGEQLAAGRPAMGFTLDGTRIEDVQAWAREHGMTCNTPKLGHDLECAPTPGASDSKSMPLQALWLDFGLDGRLASVTAVREDKNPDVASQAFLAIAEDVQHTAGPPKLATGDGSPSSLTSGLLVQSSREYRFSNYYALERVANLGQRYVLTEEYRSLQ